MASSYISVTEERSTGTRGNSHPPDVEAAEQRLPAEMPRQATIADGAFSKGAASLPCNRPARASALQSLQETHGNRAVQRYVQRPQRSTATTTLPVQREVCGASGHSSAAVAAWYNGECTDELGTTRYTSSPVGNYAVVPGAPGHDRVLAPRSRNEVTEEEHQRVSNAWDRLDSRMYINGRGSSPAENQRLQQRFRNMLREDMQDSPALRNVTSNIALGHQSPFAVNVGEHQHDVFADSFETREVDLADLEGFGTGREANRHRDQLSRGEVITHFLAERYHDVSHPVADGNLRSRFTPSHTEAIRQQNLYRTERGQAPLISSTMTDPDRLTGRSTATFRMRGGVAQQMTVDAESDVIDSRMLGVSGRAHSPVRARPGHREDDEAASYASAAELARQDLMGLEENY
jgi:hypothetical protein